MLSQVREGRSCKASLKVMLGCACSNGVCLFERLFERNRGHALPCVCLAAAAAGSSSSSSSSGSSSSSSDEEKHECRSRGRKIACRRAVHIQVCVCVCVWGVRTRMGAGTRIQLTHASNTRYAGALD